MSEKAMKTIYENCHSFAININDTFYYACADSAEIDSYDMGDLLPLIDKYEFWAFVAYEAIKRGHDPQIKKHADHPLFIEAKKEILDIISKADEYGEFYELRYSLKKQNH